MVITIIINANMNCTFNITNKLQSINITYDCCSRASTNGFLINLRQSSWHKKHVHFEMKQWWFIKMNWLLLLLACSAWIVLELKFLQNPSFEESEWVLIGWSSQKFMGQVNFHDMLHVTKKYWECQFMF